MGLFDALFGRKQSVSSVSTGNTFRSYVKVEDGDAACNTQAEVFALIGAVGTFWRIWYKTIAAQTLVRWGYGSPALPDNQGEHKLPWINSPNSVNAEIVNAELTLELYSRKCVETIQGVTETVKDIVRTYAKNKCKINKLYLWFAAGLAGTGFDVGVLRIMQETYNGNRTLVVAEIPDTALHTATSTTLATATPIDRNQMIAFPEKTEFPRVGQDSRLVLMYRPDVLVAEDFAQFSIPVTIIQ